MLLLVLFVDVSVDAVLSLAYLVSIVRKICLFSEDLQQNLWCRQLALIEFNVVGDGPRLLYTEHVSWLFAPYL